MATTEGHRVGLPVRTRIAVAVAALVGLALAGTGLLLLLIGSASTEERIRDEIDREFGEFANLQSNGVDPETGEPFGSVERLIRVYLERNVAAPSELQVGFWDGRIRVASASTHGELVSDAAFADTVSELSDTGGSRTLSTRWGDVFVDVLPLDDGRITGSFAVAYFVDEEKAELRNLLRTYAVAALLALVVVTAVAAWVSGRLLTPVRTLRATAEEITETDLSRRIPVTGNDDLTDLTRTVNAMLDRLQSAFSGQRAFLDDAGHELRTPLTILRGHLELLDPHDAEEVDRTRELLLDEIDRMSLLVDDLILLTKSDRPGFFSFRRVPVADLTDTVAAKVRALGERTWLVDERATVVAVLDEQRITQVLVQLALNAVQHTEPSDTVAIGSSYSPSRETVTFWVRDTGPGVPVEDRTRIFERFVRGGEQSTSDGGFGLGLSLVSAIVAGHEGRVWVEDASPPGARFVIELPMTRKER